MRCIFSFIRAIYGNIKVHFSDKTAKNKSGVELLRFHTTDSNAEGYTSPRLDMPHYFMFNFGGAGEKVAVPAH